jgi:hypothetical protein
VRQRLSEKRGAEEAGKLKEVLAEVAPDAVDSMSDGGDETHSSGRYEKLINIKDRGQIFRVDVDAAAWDAVEELQAEASHQKQVKPKNSFEKYCDDNPDAAECRIYDE